MVGKAQSAHASEAVTHAVGVTVTPRYAPEQSDPAQPNHVFSYTIRITNNGRQPVQLLSRRWLIVDALGRRSEVEGEGVIGKQPRLEPGESFEYSSWCPLRTTWGTMEGSYTMLRGTDRIEVPVPRFYLTPDA